VSELVRLLEDEYGLTLPTLRSLGGGVPTFGLLRNATYYVLSDLVEPFLLRHPQGRRRRTVLHDDGDPPRVVEPVDRANWRV